MARVYFDITGQLRWTSRLTGIQRVTHEIVTSYPEAGARLVYFSRLLGRFAEVDLLDYCKLFAAASQEPSWQSSRLMMARLARSGLRHPTFQAGDKLVFLGGDWTNRAVWKSVDRMVKLRGIEAFPFVHDVLPMTHPQFFADSKVEEFERYMRDAFRCATRVLTSSQFNYKNITELTTSSRLPQCDITVVPLARCFGVPGEAVRPDFPLLPRSYVLIVGTLEVRKNPALLYNVIKLAQMSGIDLPTFVLAGQSGWLADDAIHLLTRDPTLADKISFVGPVSDAELKWLYLNCKFTLYPSYCEGWGLPIGESLALNRVCLSSNAGAMPEVGQADAIYFDPLSARDCLDRIAENLDDKAIYRRERLLGQNFQERQWSTVAGDLAIAVQNS